MGLIIPNSFASKSSAQLSDLDENFTYLKTEIDPYIDNILVDESGAVTIGGGVIADITGNVTGDVTGDVTGNVSGNLTGNVTGNVDGNISGTATLEGSSTLISGATLSSTQMGSIYAPGMVVQVQTAISNADQTISSVTPTTITGLSINFTPKFANSKIVITASITNSAVYVYSFGVFRDGVATGDTTGRVNSNDTNMQVTGYIGWTNSNQLLTTPVMHAEIAGSTAMRTYDIRGTSAWSGSVYTLYINNRVGLDMASSSHMIIYEIAQ